MLTPQRRHDHRRVSRHLELDRPDLEPEDCFSWNNKCHLGRYYKRRLNKAWRAYFKARLRGNRGKEPVTLTSEVNWRGS